MCPIHGEVSSDQIVSGFEHSKGQYVIIDTDELDKLRSEDDKAINIDTFVAKDTLDPLYNFDNVKEALLVAADGDGIGLSRRRITLSTSGVVPMIGRAGEEIGVMLAISLHAVTDALRDSSCRSIGNTRSPSCSPPAGPIRASPTRGASRSNMSC